MTAIPLFAIPAAAPKTPAAWKAPCRRNTLIAGVRFNDGTARPLAPGPS